MFYRHIKTEYLHIKEDITELLFFDSFGNYFCIFK